MLLCVSINHTAAIRLSFPTTTSPILKLKEADIKQKILPMVILIILQQYSLYQLRLPGNINLVLEISQDDGSH